MKKRLWCLILCVLFLSAVNPVPALGADAGDFTVTGGDLDTDFTFSSSVLKFIQPGSYTVSMKSAATSTDNRIEISGGTPTNPMEITLAGVSISPPWDAAIFIEDGSYVRLNLAAGTVNALTGGTMSAGITCPKTATLIIGGTGTLNVTGSEAGIGGSAGIAYAGDDASGTIIITGGTVTAQGGSNCAGIGGGGAAINCGPVTINGGIVTARGGNYSPGIGGGTNIIEGRSGAVDTITITGGSVTAIGGNCGPGIGCSGSYGGADGTVAISGGTVIATGSGGGTGIGGGMSGRGCTVIISGGTVTATGSNDVNGDGGAGIGGGSAGDGGAVSITGGSVIAKGGNGAKDIGAGKYRSGGTLTNGDANRNDPVYLTTVTLEGAADKTEVTSLTADTGYGYGSTGMKTDASGKLYLYLPVGTETTAAATAGGMYTGSITTTADNLAAGTLSVLGYVQLAMPKNLAWGATTPGKATWNAVTYASSHSVQLYKDGTALGDAVSVAGGEYDFTSAIHAAGNGNYTFTVTALGDGTNYRSSPVSAVSPAYNYINPTAAPPVITTGRFLPDGVKNMPYSATLEATGTPPIRWSLVGSISIGFSLSEDGVVSGYSPSAYSFGFTAKAENDFGSATKEFIVTIKDPSELPGLGTISAPNLKWDSTIPGKAKWTQVNHAAAYSVQLYKNGTALGSPVRVSSLEYDFTSAIAAAGSGSYTFSVRALGDGVNYGDGDMSAQSVAYVYETVPSAPQNLTATPGDGQVTLGWSAPAENGGAAITGYEVSSDNGAAWSNADSGTGHTFTGLTNGQSYTFRVRAINSEGPGAEAAVTATPHAASPPHTSTRPRHMPRILTDSATGIIVSGGGTRGGTQLIVQPLSLHDPCAACDAIRRYMDDDDYTVLFNADLSLSRSCSGELTITIPVGTQYNGQTLTLLHCYNGELETLTAVVTDGKAVFTVRGLSPIAVFAQDGLDDIPKTGDSHFPWAWWLLCGSSAAGMAVLIGLYRRKLNQQ